MTLQEYLAKIVSFNTVSSDDPAVDRSNKELIAYLERFFISHNFYTMVVSNRSGKYNLLALAPSVVLELLQQRDVVAFAHYQETGLMPAFCTPEFDAIMAKTTASICQNPQRTLGLLLSGQMNP